MYYKRNTYTHNFENFAYKHTVKRVHNCLFNSYDEETIFLLFFLFFFKFSLKNLKNKSFKIVQKQENPMTSTERNYEIFFLN